MPTPGPWTWFNKALERIDAGDMVTNTIKAILVDDDQSFDENFVGSSGSCLYSDITDELATANGYTNGGLTLTSSAISLASGLVKWVTAAFSWTLSGSISFRWIILVDSTSGELIAFADLNTDGATDITAIAGILGFSPLGGAWLTWDQP